MLLVSFADAGWIAHVGGRVTHMVEEMGILISIGVCGHVPQHSFQP